MSEGFRQTIHVNLDLLVSAFVRISISVYDTHAEDVRSCGIQLFNLTMLGGSYFGPIPARKVCRLKHILLAK